MMDIVFKENDIILFQKNAIPACFKRESSGDDNSGCPIKAFEHDKRG
ncbi:MAG: hypothetical protein MRK01_16240 [Candidatus Scalindua sp.]|nr:hypothetical protein [Candidatus Scalindua sp.]